ncbi:helix-turn-helix domain-containing protein [Taibaiella soli]|uniref:HTH araC/xylS-type domain-containing protein n=1 Tax=Taibaiella soli TaxID=1649169 RepID=A0A2W2ATK6_9BACT|nr:AraC family transcriptional regulator [Taibaiella soli]PZF71038.1 hypothetical protein DN068_20270 [Taibaiella soli]
MIEIDFYYSVSKNYLIKFVEVLNKASGEKATQKGNRIYLQPSIADGFLEFHEFQEGISVLITDCTLRQELRFRQMNVSGNDTYRIVFNIGQPIPIIMENGQKIVLGSDFAEAVMFTSHTAELSGIVATGTVVKTITIIFHRTWAIDHLLHNAVPLRVTRLQLFANNMPMQFTTHLDLQCYELACEMLTQRAPAMVLPHLLEGYTYQMAALFFNSVVEDEVGEKRFISEAAMRVIQLKERLEQNLSEELPTLNDAATICLMSKNRFADMFKSLFGNSYAAFFLDLKMKKAKELLRTGSSVADTGYEVGYSNVSHFVKTFRRHFGITPGVYQAQRG